MVAGYTTGHTLKMMKGGAAEKEWKQASDADKFGMSRKVAFPWWKDLEMSLS